MNAKLLTDKALRDDLYIELMYMAGTLGVYRQNPTLMGRMDVRGIIEEQLDMLMPTVKRHIKRHVKQTKLELAQQLQPVLIIDKRGKNATT